MYRGGNCRREHTRRVYARVLRYPYVPFAFFSKKTSERTGEHLLERGNWEEYTIVTIGGGEKENSSGNDFSIEASARFPALRCVPESLGDVLRDRNDAISSYNAPVVDRFLIMPRRPLSRFGGHWCDVRFEDLQKSNRAMCAIVREDTSELTETDGRRFRYGGRMFLGRIET